MAASQKLSHLLQLADQGPALRAALAEEVAELLAAWPPDYPQNMRNICQTLLVKAARDLDAPTRARLRAQLDCDPELLVGVLPREAAVQTLIAAARSGENLPATLAACLGVDSKSVHRILADESGAALAAACKRARMDRATFSALALMAWPARDRTHAFAVLDAFDTVPPGTTAAKRADQLSA